MTDNIPPIHVHEGRLNGRFSLPPADMPHIQYQGRVMLVLLADATAITIKDIPKEGLTGAFWVFKAVDAAVVRDESMREHLVNALYLEGDDAPTKNYVDVPLAPEGKQYEGVYDEEGTFLGIEAVDDMQEFGASKVGQPADDLDDEEEIEAEPREPLFKAKQPATPTAQYNASPSTVGNETYGKPVQYKDPVLAGFIGEE